MRSASAVIPVRDGGPLLGRVLEAVRDQGELELVVVDSGSTDGSLELARSVADVLVEIPHAEFGHGRTRNLAAERTSGELICFLTQDALPQPGWLAAHREAFELDPRVGASFGPHLPNPETTPMISRELLEFFAGFSPDGGPTLQRAGGLTFLSNVNACYSRECWAEIRFEDLPYSEDQAFGRAMLEAGWVKVFHPDAAVRHAHEYGPLDFVKRYFDEYRGLNETSGHVEPLRPSAALRGVGDDARWMRDRGVPAREIVRWLGRSALHHGGRRVGSALGSRAERLPSRAQRALSLEGRGAAAAPAATEEVPGGTITEGRPNPYEGVLRLAREGIAPLDDPVPGMADRPLHVATVIPPFGPGSGGHGTIFKLLAQLERRGHTCSTWVHDPRGLQSGGAPSVRREIVEGFEALAAPVHLGFDNWSGADVVLATGWDTVYPSVLLPGCRARAYLIQDHEPDFLPVSAEAAWCAGTYGLGLYGISAGRWLHDLVESRYGQRGTWFRLGVDHSTYRPRPVGRRRDTVVFYAREVTARRAVPLGALALEELKRRRPGVRVVLFGETHPYPLSFEHEHLGVVGSAVLARHYAAATAGLCLSLTNWSLVPQEMLACGLPCVDLAGGSTETEVGKSGAMSFAEPDPSALAGALEALLDDEELWARRSRAGIEFARSASWEKAASQVEEGLREALRERERKS